MLENAGSVLEIASKFTGAALTGAILLGLLVRRRYRLCYSFMLYILVILVGDLLLAWGPMELATDDLLFPFLGEFGFQSRRFWLVKEMTINLLRFAVAIELAYRTFRSFPGARATARGVVFLLLVVTLVSVVVATPHVAAAQESGGFVEIAVTRLQPRILNGTIWLLTGIAALILWYRLPVDRFHKAILTGVVPYLLVFTVALNLLDTYGFQEMRVRVNQVSLMAYLLLVAYWARAAWAPFRAPARAPEPALTLERQVG
jgi:hypothetical protein